MPKETIIVGLDVGSCFIRVVVAKTRADQSKPQILGVGQAPSFGLRRGVVVDVEEATKNISQAVQAAESNSGLSIERVIVSISGNHITPRISKGVIAVSRADGEVSSEDVERAINAAAAIPIPANRDILHVIPRNYTVDDQEGIKDPVGMNGVRMELDALVIEGSTPFIRNLDKCISEAGLEAEELVLAPLAASYAALSKRQKELGVLVLDLGGGTAGLTVFEEGYIIHSCVLPVGSSHITNDIAIGLRSDIDLAEKVKLEYGSALFSEINKKDTIDLAKLGSREGGVIPRAQVVEIMEARLSEILELANKELKGIDRQGLLPAGVILLGGGAKVPGLVDLAREELRLPVQVGFPTELDGIIDEVEDPAFATAIGLILWSVENQAKSSRQGVLPPGRIGSSVDKVKRWFREFLP